MVLLWMTWLNHMTRAQTYHYILCHYLPKYNLTCNCTQMSQQYWHIIGHNLHYYWNIHLHLCDIFKYEIEQIHRLFYSLPLHCLPSFARTKPLLQLHWNDPAVLVHASAHLPLFVEHSLMSAWKFNLVRWQIQFKEHYYITIDWNMLCKQVKKINNYSSVNKNGPCVSTYMYTHQKAVLREAYTVCD